MGTVVAFWIEGVTFLACFSLVDAKELHFALKNLVGRTKLDWSRAETDITLINEQLIWMWSGTVCLVGHLFLCIFSFLFGWTTTAISLLVTYSGRVAHQHLPSIFFVCAEQEQEQTERHREAGKPRVKSVGRGDLPNIVCVCLFREETTATLWTQRRDGRTVMCVNTLFRILLLYLQGCSLCVVDFICLSVRDTSRIDHVASDGRVDNT